MEQQPKALDRFQRLAKKRRLSFLVIGGYAVSALSKPRFTADIDFVISRRTLPLAREIMAEMKYSERHSQDAFCQFSPPAAHHPPIDFMLVDDSTWNKLWAEHVTANLGCEEPLDVVSVKHLIAMKAHSLSEPTRQDKSKDFEDIVQLAVANNITFKNLEDWGIIERYNLGNYLNILKERLLK